jgi:hypothetical protein
LIKKNTRMSDDPSNGWTKAKESKLLEWQQQSRLHSLGHGRSQELYSKKNDQIQIPSIILGALAVFFDGVALLWDDKRPPFIICALLLTAIATIFNGILQVTKPIEFASGHEDMAKGYNKIILQIDSVLIKEFAERQSGNTFVSMIEEELIALKTGGVKIPSSVWASVKKDFMAGECDFQKLEDEAGFGGKPFQYTIKLKTRPEAEPVSAPMPAPSEPPTPSGSTVIDIDEATATEPPRFELRIGNGGKKIENLFFDYHMSRFN